MPRGYRYALLTAFGLLAAASPPGERASREQAQAQRSIAESLRAIDAALKNANEPGEEAKPCPKGEDNRRSDLCAQWKAADAAAEGALWTERTFYLGLGGLAVALLTLGAAAAAAYFAYVASEQARRSNLLNMRENARASRRYAAGAGETADALHQARRSADVAERNLIFTQRAILFTKPSINWMINPETGKNYGLRGSMELTNYGNTEARNIETIAGMIVADRLDEVSLNSIEPIKRDYVFPRAGASYFGLFTAGGGDIWSDIVAKRKHLFLFGKVSYDDILTATRHHLEFCYKVLLDGIPDDPAAIIITSERHGPHNRVYDE